MDSMYREPATMLLAGRKYVYKLLQKLWLAPPEREHILHLHDPSLQILLELMTPSEELDLNTIFNPLKDGQLAFIQDEECYLAILAEEYAELIGGTDMDAPVSFFAAAYLGMQGEELKNELRMVQATYERYGAFSGESLLADSHLALEFGFMGHTSGLAQQAVEVGKDDRVALLLEEQDWFLKEHMLKWIPVWYQQIHDGHGHFYKTLADFTYAFVQADIYGIASILEILDQD